MVATIISIVTLHYKLNLVWGCYDPTPFYYSY